MAAGRKRAIGIATALVLVVAGAAVMRGVAQDKPPAWANKGEDWAAQKQQLQAYGDRFATSWDLFQHLRKAAGGGKNPTWAQMAEPAYDWSGVFTRTGGGLEFDADLAGRPPKPEYFASVAKGAPGTAPVVIDQKGCEYLPYINTASVNQTIRVLNSDPVMHNIHPTPTVDGNKESNKAQLPKGAPLDHSFTKAEKFLRFKCDVHPWMFSYVSVFETPFHAVSGKDGSFKITGVPDGKYKLVVEHRKAGKVEKEIEVKGGAKADATLEVK